MHQLVLTLKMVLDESMITIILLIINYKYEKLKSCTP